MLYDQKQGQALKAPFPWFGGKSKVAGLVWERFGDVANYVEPFAGSLAVLLALGVALYKLRRRSAASVLLAGMLLVQVPILLGLRDHCDGSVCGSLHRLVERFLRSLVGHAG